MGTFVDGLVIAVRMKGIEFMAFQQHVIVKIKLVELWGLEASRKFEEYKDVLLKL